MSAKIYWEQALKTWPRERPHPMVNFLEVREDISTQSLGTVERYKKEELWEMKSGDLVPFSTWVGERIPMTGEFTGMIFIREGEILYVEMKSQRDAIMLYPSLLHSAQVQSLRYKYALSWNAVAPSYTRTMEKKRVHVYLTSTSPCISAIKAYEGQPDTAFFSFMEGDTEYCLSSWPKKATIDKEFVAMHKYEGWKGELVKVGTEMTGVELNSERPKVPFSPLNEVECSVFVKMTWQRHSIRQVRDQAYLGEEIYKYNRHEYDTWTYASHRDQVKQIMPMIPLDMPVTAPGDGYGVVEEVAKPRVVVTGDLFPVTGGVERETFEETMARGSGCLILSYVLSLMGEADLKRVQKWPGPVVIIDSRDHIGLSGFERTSPGVHVRGLDKSLVMPIREVEGFQMDSMLYSENALRIPTISEPFPTVPSTYWKLMRPLAVVSENKNVICLAGTIKDYFLMEKDHSKVWLMGLGKEVDEIRVGSLTPGSQMKTRTLYWLLSPVPDSFKRKVHWHVEADNFYFLSHSPQEIDVNGIKVIIGKKEKCHPIRLLAVSKKEIIWDVTGVIVTWPYNDFTLMNTSVYLRVHGEPGWKVKFFGSVDEYNTLIKGLDVDDVLIRELMDWPGEKKRDKMHIPWYWKRQKGDWHSMSRAGWIESLRQKEGFSYRKTRYWDYQGDEQDILWEDAEDF